MSDPLTLTTLHLTAIENVINRWKTKAVTLEEQNRAQLQTINALCALPESWLQAFDKADDRHSGAEYCADDLRTALRTLGYSS